MEQLVIRTWKFLRQLFSLDETGIKKHGKYSACVSRQWQRCLGKQDKGQVFVAATLCGGKFFSVVWMKLFMPKSRNSDKVRSKKSHIPSDEKHLSKTKKAGKIIEKIQAILGCTPYWVGFDALYGTCLELLYQLDDVKQRFVGEIKRDTRFFLISPQPFLPEHAKGRPAKYYHVEQKSVTVEQYLKTLSDQDFQLITYREGTKKDMQACYHRKTVWIWHKAYDHPICCELLLKKEAREIKVILISMADGITTKKLAHMQGQRCFVEQSFKESKNQAGLPDYQIRSWKGTHRHMACAMLALNFLMEQRYTVSLSFTHVTIPDLVTLIAILIPERKKTRDDFLNAFIEKHREYEKQIKQNLDRDRRRTEKLLTRPIEQRQRFR